MPRAILILTALCLAGCASQPRVLTSASQPLPPPAAFRLGADDPAAAAVAAGLGARGFAPAPAGAPAVYAVQAGYSVRPTAVGLQSAEGAALTLPTRQRFWQRGERQAYRLSVSIDDAATGRPLWRGSADAVAPPEGAQRVRDRMIEALLSAAP